MVEKVISELDTYFIEVKGKTGALEIYFNKRLVHSKLKGDGDIIYGDMKQMIPILK